MIKGAFSAVYKPEPGGGYSAFCPELGVASQGETIEEAEANLKEAVELYLESAKELGILEQVLGEAGVDIRRIEGHVPRGSRRFHTRRGGGIVYKNLAEAGRRKLPVVSGDESSG
jgi:predicted RNase H-like HicB family nuclease